MKEGYTVQGTWIQQRDNCGSYILHRHIGMNFCESMFSPVTGLFHYFRNSDCFSIHYFCIDPIPPEDYKMLSHWTSFPKFMPVGPDILTLVVGSDISRCPNTPWPTCRGYLHKRTHSGFVKGWRKRWFVLKHDGYLLYYKHRKVMTDRGKNKEHWEVKPPWTIPCPRTVLQWIIQQNSGNNNFPSDWARIVLSSKVREF